MSLFSKKSNDVQNLILELDPLASKLEKKGRRVVRLNRGDPSRYFATPKYIIDAYIDALKSGKTYYSRAQGVRELADAVVSRYRKYGMRLSQEDVIITAGVSEALLFLNNALINPGDRAVLLSPYYPQYIPRIKVEGGNPVIGSLIMENDWQLDIADLNKRIKKLGRSGKSRIKYMMITNPSNPTGKVFARKELKDIVDVANEHDLLLVSDEIYDEMVYNGSKFTSLGQVADGVPHMIFNGSSKNFDSTGFRIGFMVIPGKDKISESAKEEILAVRASQAFPEHPCAVCCCGCNKQ